MVPKPRLERSLAQPVVMLVTTAWRVALLHGPRLQRPVNQVLTVGTTEVVFERTRGASRERSRQVASGDDATLTRAEEH